MRLKLSFAVLLFAISLTFGCQNNIFQPANTALPAMREVPSVRLNYKYEPDVPAPTIEANKTVSNERNTAVQADFDANRQLELLDRTIASPDQKRILAVYHRISDMPDQDQMDVFRLDMYSSEGWLLRKLTSETMAAYFPETIVWSPDSGSIAFVAKTRAVQASADGALPTPADNANAATSSELGGNSDITGNTANSNSQPARSSPTPAPPTGILTFRTQQIYICNAEGNGLKPLTQNEGLIYFYYTWSPDNAMLAAMATTAREWKYFEITAAARGEMMVPYGRLRIVEKNGRERRLDDNQTQIWPVWSPESTRVAAAYDVEIPDAQDPNRKRRDTQIRIYDASGTNPTQAAILLRNQLLISSLAYDRQQQKLAQSGSNENTGADLTPEPEQPLSTLPDENTLVSYNPIVEIAWPSEELLYLKTAYLKRMPNVADNVTSFARWHRLVLSPQATASPK
jgi:hypothetical protein